MIPIGKRLYVRLEQGEKFKIRITNRLSIPIRFGLWVDGVNSVGSTVENPGLIDDLNGFNSRVWILHGAEETDAKATFAVGYRVGNVAQEAPFVVDREENALATMLGAGEKIGLITGIIYTADVPVRKPIPVFPPDLPGRPGRRRIGIIPGEFKPARVDWVPSRIGPMVAAMSVYYRTGEEIRQLQSVVDYVASPNETELFRDLSRAQAVAENPSVTGDDSTETAKPRKETDPFRAPDTDSR